MAKVLLLGEGDFSWAAALAAASPTTTVVATGLDSRLDLERKYGDTTSRRLDSLSRLPNAEVVHGVDGTADLRGADKLPDCARDLTVVAVRYPHSGLKSVEANRRMLTGLLARMAELLSDPARCAPSCVAEITLKTTGRYNAWAGDLRKVVPRGEGGLVLQGVKRPRELAGYAHVTTTGRVDLNVRNDQAATWTFALRGEGGAGGGGGRGGGSGGSGIDAGLPAWLAVEIAEELHSCALCDKVFTTEGDLEKHTLGKGHQQRRRSEKRREKLAAKMATRKRKHADTDGGDAGGGGGGGAVDPDGDCARADRPMSRKERRLARKADAAKEAAAGATATFEPPVASATRR
jgi:hypothetical protein